MNPPPPAEGLASRLFLGPALRTQPDRRLVTLVRDGYETAFEEIVRRYGKALGRYAAAIVGGRSEEVTQDAFSKALLALRKESEAEIELRPWLYRIVRNTALNDLRDRPPDTTELAEALGGGSRSAAEEFERREELSELLERLRALPEPQRAAIVMRELEGLGHEEIATALGMSGGGARQAIYRARQALRDGLGMMVPLPLLRSLFDHGVEAGAAAGAGGAVAAGSAMGGAGAGTALKVGVVTAVLAGGVGTGLALKDRSPERGVETAAAAVHGGTGSAESQPASAAARSAAAVPSDGSGATGGEGTGGGEGEHGLQGDLGRGGESGGSSGRGTSGSGDEGGGRGPGPSQGAGTGRSGLGSGSGDGRGDGGGSHSGDPGTSGGGPGPSGGGSGPSGDGGTSGGGDGGLDGSGGGNDSGAELPPPPTTGGDGSAGSGDGSGSGDLRSGSGSDGSGSGDAVIFGSVSG
jgi:RNA polymerase sigma factor (sigma-70 family)